MSLFLTTEAVLPNFVRGLVYRRAEEREISDISGILKNRSGILVDVK